MCINWVKKIKGNGNEEKKLTPVTQITHVITVMANTWMVEVTENKNIFFYILFFIIFFCIITSFWIKEITDECNNKDIT